MKLAPARYAPPRDLLQDRIVLVTGAGSGLGRALALACAAHGAIVVLAGRTVAKLESVYDAIKAAGGRDPAIFPVDLAGAAWKDYAELARSLETEFGKLHGIVHCAAYFKRFTPLAESDPKDWLESLQVNLTAAFALTHHCLPLLQKAGAASVVFVSDEAGRKGKPYTGSYGVAKAAVEGLMRTWAQELDPKLVRFNSYDPGAMKTELRRRGFMPEGDKAARPIEEAVPGLLWLLGADSAGITGEALSRPASPPT